MPEKKTIKTRYHQVKDWLDSNVPPIVPQVITAAASVGTFLVLTGMAEANRKAIAYNQSYIQNQDLYRQSQKDMINYAEENNLSYSHFPGIGVLVRHPHQSIPLED
jgi:hypothetical protein